MQTSSSCAVHWQGIWDSQIWRPLLPHHGVHVRGSSCYKYLTRTQTLPSVWNDLVTGPIIVECMCPFLVMANGVQRIFPTKRLHNVKLTDGNTAIWFVDSKWDCRVSTTRKSLSSLETLKRNEATCMLCYPSRVNLMAMYNTVESRYNELLGT